jgi:pimeloyl-ACP methyl ester carboxylesterase
LYSYNICGSDLKKFLEEVIREPSVVSGLSSGAVLAVWLGANAPGYVIKVIAEDPPMFSSIYPRISQEKYMSYLFRLPIETLGGKTRDLESYYKRSGIPKDGTDELTYIPAVFVKLIMKLFKASRIIHPDKPCELPLMPFSMRSSLMFLCEYDVDFSKATLDGRLSAGFDPVVTLANVQCPMLLMRATSSVHETWGLLGAMTDDDVKKIQQLVPRLTCSDIKSAHAIHLTKPKLYLNQVIPFIDEQTV